jgi:hypothetical protein
MEKKIKAVKMVREIRDELYDEMKDLSDEERIKFIKERAKRFTKKQKVKV